MNAKDSKFAACRHLKTNGPPLPVARHPHTHPTQNFRR